jgi:Neutral trehalase
LLPLPHPYIVPGGRFREIYYWDSYFTMLGLKESGEVQTIENMIDNFAYLIQTYGHIPNGNRSYYVSRSQPPFFALMVELLAGIKGKEMYKKIFTGIAERISILDAGQR